MAASRTLMLFAMASISASAQAAPPSSAPLGGVSACTLIELVPAPGHPLRRHPALKAGAYTLDKAGDDARRYALALGTFERNLARAFKDATSLFARPTINARTGEPNPFRSEPARFFLERWVFAPNAPLRVGEERFEPAPEVAALMAFAACRAGLPERAIQLTRGLSGDEAAPLRAFAALLLLEAERRDEALELLPTLGERGFLAPWVAAELSPAPDERLRLHALAARQLQTPDQALAHRAQALRFDMRTE